MTEKKKLLKSVKKPSKGPMKLAVSEVLEIEGRTHELSLLKEKTSLLRAEIDKAFLKKRVLELELVTQQQRVNDAQAALRVHGEKVQSKEKSYNNFREQLSEKYGVEGTLAYDPDTLEITP